jgi:hypothetical protein
MSIVHLIVFLIIIGLVLQFLSIDARVKQIIVVLLLVLCVLWLFGFGFSGIGGPRFWR